MSILQEYEQIRRRLGEPRFRRIELFLADNPELYLSDVYYKESVFKQFEKEEPRYKVLDEEKRIAEIITINKSHGFNAAEKELEAREARVFTHQEISINKAFRGYTREELRGAAVKEKLDRLGDLLYTQNAAGDVIWPIEALNTFTEKELKICKKILFPDQQSQQAEIKGGKSR